MKTKMKTYVEAQKYWARARRRVLRDPDQSLPLFCRASHDFVRAHPHVRRAWAECRQPEFMIYWLTLMGVTPSAQCDAGCCGSFWPSLANPEPFIIRKHYLLTGRRRKQPKGVTR